MQVNEKHKFHTTFHPGSINQRRRVGALKEKRKKQACLCWLRGTITPRGVCQAEVTLRAVALVREAVWRREG